MDKFRKGSPQFAFFADFYQFCEKYYQPVEDVDWWTAMTNEANRIQKKYEAIDQATSVMSRKLLCGFVDYLEEIRRRESNGK